MADAGAREFAERARKLHADLIAQGLNQSDIATLCCAVATQAMREGPRAEMIVQSISLIHAITSAVAR
jgi:hypothetical protein